MWHKLRELPFRGSKFVVCGRGFGVYSVRAEEPFNLLTTPHAPRNIKELQEAVEPRLIDFHIGTTVVRGYKTLDVGDVFHPSERS